MSVELRNFYLYFMLPEAKPNDKTYFKDFEDGQEGPMTGQTWMLYGAYGYTGQLIARQAVEKGHRPILAGRNAARLAALATTFDLPQRAFALDDPAVVAEQLSDVDLVLHSAGPFTFTAAPMRKACLQTGTHYLDITGEIAVFEATFDHDSLARQREVALVSGVGFDVVPTDCMALHVQSRLPDATRLTVGLLAGGGGSGAMRASAGTLKSMLEILKDGGLARRAGQLVPLRIGKTTRLPLRGKSYLAPAIPWGDLSTAYRSTGIPHITTYLVMPKRIVRLMQVFGVLVPLMLKITPLRRTLQWLIDRAYKQQTPTLGGTEGRTYVYVQAENEAGQRVASTLESIEAYRLTAISSVDAVEAVLAEQPSGALTPAQLLGQDYVLSLPDTQRRDET